MDKISFEKFRDFFRKKNSKKKGREKIVTTLKKTRVPSIGKKFLRRIMDSLSKYSVEQEDVIGLDITSKAVRVAQLSHEKNKWVLEKLSYKYVDIPAGLPDSKKVDIYINYIKEKFLDTFEDAVKLRMQSDVDTGCYLSGGLDSTSIATTAVKYNNLKPLNVFNAFIVDKPSASMIHHNYWIAILSS